MTETRHPSSESEWGEPAPGEPIAYVPRWLFERVDANALTVYVWLSLHGDRIPPERRTPLRVAGCMIKPWGEFPAVKAAMEALRAAGGLDAENRIQLYPPAGGE